ncbi:uncharacterized protein LOC107405745 isoform X2 [Ziziphus jujuba]|uniref:Uncharacterized protein LOC107405745 isoform X2 n=1 Tax=Ziziphus jujuba TaxID=326968 RepID=A0ABM3I0Y8_ZIZJJ|nr:uncharacterized protein LOC107405745 isoform X2 [Ziziphus jujuba]
MLEGLVRQLILGYLGRYVKDFQKEQLKITFWNEEVLLENVELILEAFDYLQLPFALKEGRVGKLSIKIPWKKLGWDPIVIMLEDVFVCASQRDDEEWSLDAVEKREFAAKKAKLAAAELAKLSKRVCDNQAGQSFTSYITAKILENIQVSIRSFHVLYHDTQVSTVHTVFGLKFSSLTIMKQYPFGSSSARVKGGLVNKNVDIIGLEFYCGTFQGPVDLMAIDNARFEGKKCDSILTPCDLSISLLVNRSGELGSSNPQYSIDADLTRLEISLDEVQLQQLMILWDYLCTSKLREKYGRYRPWSSPLSKKLKGWKLLWWQYAQESVLSDVRKRLKKTSWRYLGQRLSYRRKYVNLYKIKLYFLQQEQSIDANTLWDLEQMEKELDIDDILSYRSVAERELQEFSSNSLTFNINVNDTSVVDKSITEDRLGKSRGWLNWLSLGMLGAGGTDDCNQFSGVVSDEVIKDIYEATKFHPLTLANMDAGIVDKIYLLQIKFSIHQISATLCSLKHNQEIFDLVLNDVNIEFKLWEESATVICTINSGEMIYPCNRRAILCLGAPTIDKRLPDSEHPSCSVQVDISPNHVVELAVKAMLQPLEVTCDADFFVNCMEFFGVLNSSESQHERVLASLNRIENVDVRLLSKAEYILSNRKKVTWDVSISDILINVPWGNEIQQWNLACEIGTLLFSSKCDTGPLLTDDEEKSYILKNLLESISNSSFSMGIQFQDISDHFEVKLNDFEMKMIMPSNSEPITIFEKFNTSIKLASFIIPDESIWKQLELFVNFQVYVSLSSLHAQFSPSIYGAFLGLIAYLDNLQPKSEPVCCETLDPCNVTSNGPRNPVFGCCVNVKFEKVSLLVDLANDEEDSAALIFSLQELDICYLLTEFEECWICLKAMNITSSSLSGESDSHVLYSSGNDSPTTAAVNADVGYTNKIDVADKSISTQSCFMLHYESVKTDLARQKCTICLNDADVHCYPYVVRLLIGFVQKLSAFDTSGDGEVFVGPSAYAGNQRKKYNFGFQKFGFSNFYETGSSECASIPLDCFPFFTIYNDGSLDSLESSLLYSSPEWRKYFSLRDRRIKSPQFSVKKVLKNFHFHAQELKSTPGRQAHLTSGSSGDTAQSVIDFSLSGIRMHFHDSSCIIGTVTLSSSNCSSCVYENCMDVLCSIEGLILTSSWWTKNFREFLWGPAVPNLSPIINVRVRKEKYGSLSSQFEVGISVQHVYCILPPEYLAIIIGYFSLPDWCPDSVEQSTSKGNENSDAENESSIVYKFEVLDSILILPVEGNEHQFLKTGIQQLYCSFAHRNSLNNVFRGIPPEYLMSVHKLAKSNNCLNIFGRDLFLSLLSYRDDGYGCLRLDQDAVCANTTLVGPLSADVWVRIPCDSISCGRSTDPTTCIIRIANCQVMPDGQNFYGFEALRDVINQFTLVSDQSKCFKSDVLQFLQLKRCLREFSAASPISSGVVFTEVRCHVHSLVIELYRLRKGSNELIAKSEMQFIFSASLQNDSVIGFDLSFSSLALFSLPDCVVLARCASTCCTSSVLDISLPKVDQGENKLYLSLPSLDVWLHLSNWFEVIDLFISYAEKLSRSEPSDAMSRNLTPDTNDTLGNLEVTVSPSSLHSSMASTCLASENIKLNNVFLTVKSENICITFHLPIWVGKEAYKKVQVAEDHMAVPPNVSFNLIDGNGFKYIAVTLHSKSSELLLDGRLVKLKSNIEKLSGIIAQCQDNSAHSWPLFQIYHISVEAEISNKQMEPVHVKVELECNHLDVSLSHHFFYFWHGIPVNLPLSGSSQFPFSGIDLKLNIQKVSFLLSDGRWSCSGPLFDILVRNILLHVNVTENSLDGSVTGEVQVNYNNIHKVFWEPFIEPWQFEINMTRKQEMSLNNSAVTEIHLQSSGQLSLNFTESLIECGFRSIEMIKDSLGVVESNDFPESQELVHSPYMEHIYEGRYAPYVLQNLTCLPLVYHVYKGSIDELDISEIKGGKSVESGTSIPIYIDDAPADQLLHVNPTHSSDKLNDQKSNAHHYISVQLDGTSVSSAPISMDLVGLTYFEVDFSKANNENCQENRADSRSGVVPVVFDVSVQRYSKLIRLYSTVILSNATSMSLELRFDIPFGVSPKILDPIYPGQELPLPLHLAEAGCMRWRPTGNSYLWSEVYNLSNLLSQETKIGFLKSFVCYPVQPSSDPFRCCISVRNISLPGCRSKMSSSHIKNVVNPPLESYSQKLNKLDESSKWFVHQLTLSTPLVVNNYLPKELSLATESAGVTRTTFLSEVETFFHHIDPSHDLGMEIFMPGFKPSTLKFPRAETFCTVMSKLNETKFSQSEIMIFDPDMTNGKTYVTVEKMMDAFSGARELFIYVPFLLYNCTSFHLLISETVSEMNGVSATIPSSYDMADQLLLEEKSDGLSLVSSSGNPHAKDPQRMGSSSSCHIISTRNNANPLDKKRFPSNVTSSSFLESSIEPSSKNNFEDHIASFSSSNNILLRSKTGWTPKNSNFMGYEHGKVKACMYSPIPSSAAKEVMVRIRRCEPEHITKDMARTLWSSPFPIVPPSGSTTVLVPQLSSNTAFMVSVTSSSVSGPFSGRITAITFQPRYVICNACSKDLCYKQKGTDFVFNLGKGEHSHLHWMDSTRELLVSIRYNEPGWQWSGGFLPEHLGDTQVKMRDYVSGSLKIVRVEVQNADVSAGDETIVGSLHGNSGTNLILLSDDDTGYMPYRVDNFSRERLRIFQQRCEAFETIVHSYTSCPYAWDEPCYPHRLTLEVPGERVLGSYALDDVKEYMPVYLPSSCEKPERTLLLSVHAEGATKVLSVIDSSFHIDMESSRASHLGEQRKHEHKQDKFSGYKEKISVVIPYISISLINFQPQELLSACAKNITIDLLQSLDQQKLFFQISSLQIDNQLRSTPYPVMLSFDREYKGSPSSLIRAKDDGRKPRSERIFQISFDSSFEPVFNLAVSKWRKKDISLVSFQYISLRVADFRLELEQELILKLFEFFKNLSSRFHNEFIPLADPLMGPLIYNTRSIESLANVQTSDYLKARGNNFDFAIVPILNEKHHHGLSLPSVIPIGAPWQKMHLLARRQRKIYVEMFDLGPIKLTLSFSSSLGMLRKGILTSGESLIHRGLMAVADVEGARIHLKQLVIAHQIASWESIQEILIRHYARQLLHEMYKVFGSAGVIGNPMGFARSLGLGIRDFLSVPARSIFQSPTGLITGMAQGTTSLLSNTVYAISDAATQFSRVAHKGIVAFTFDDQTVSRTEHQQIDVESDSKGVINEVLEGLTGLLQSPIKGAEKHGVPGVLSGIALGITGLVAKPTASILQVTGKTAQSIRNRSRVYQLGSQRFRMRLPRPLSREFPLRPYSWEEAVGTSVLVEVDDGSRFKDEVLVKCKALKKAGKFVIITERLVLIVSCSSLVDLGKPDFHGIPTDLEWVIESEIGLESVIHADSDQGVVHIVGSSSDTLLRHTQQGKRGGTMRTLHWSSPTLPLVQTNLELAYGEDAENLLQVLLSTIELGKVHGWGCRYLLHRSGIKKVRS